MKQYKSFFFCCGLIMFASELWKQWTLTFQINDGHYIWWYFPFQLCSIPMYVCLILAFVQSEKSNRILLAFLMNFGLLAGIFTFFDTSGMHYTYLPLTVHSYVWHVLLIVIGLRAGVVYRQLLSQNSSQGNEQTLCADNISTKTDYRGSCGIYLGCALLATIFNVAFSRLGTINMFYINPYLPMSQKVFGNIAAAFGNGVGIAVYIGAILFGAWFLHRIWTKTVKINS